MVLYQHMDDFSITINGHDLMLSRQHESELALARLGCAHLHHHKTPRVLIGGLGMGYTLRQALDMLGPQAHVVVVELLDAVVEWNREFFGDLNGCPLADRRVDLKTDDVVAVISRAKGRFDAILLDMDNGPDGMTDSGNRRLYGSKGIRSCQRALRKKGVLSMWSAELSKAYEQRLMGCGFSVRRFPVPPYKGSKARSRFIWVACEDRRVLPSAGSRAHLSL